jgi:aspartyl protease family protein
MRNVILFALFMLGIAAYAPRLYMEASANKAAGASVAAYGTQSQAANSRMLTLFRGSNGHFEADASVNGRRMKFLVDTGASVVVLRQSEAARLGFHPTPRDYRAKVATANGNVMAAPTDLNRVEIGSVVVHNVAALVLPDEALAQNLLGMSFLSRVRFEHRNGRLILEQ